MKKILKDYFTFSRKERTAFIILLMLIAVFIVLPYFVPLKTKENPVNETLQQQAKALLVKDSVHLATEETTNNEFTNENNTATSAKYELFEFNPNSIDAEGWKQLGLRDKTINTILNYRSKGGRFKNAEDIRKIWGLKKDEADRIIPYIKIDATLPANSFHKTEIAKAIANIDLNIATPEHFFQLTGVDHSLAFRIIKYRDKLGGFLNIEQVKETYGITDSAFQIIQPHLILQTIKINKLNINSADDYTLSMHPYISKDVAKAIVIYRSQHGAYTKVDDIKKIVFIKEPLFQKIAPYLSVE